MGIGTAFKLFRQAPEASNVVRFPMDYSRTGIVSPWAEGQLQGVVWSQIFGQTPTVATRADAMSLPSVNVGRALLVSAIASRPLRALKGGQLVDPQPKWLSRSTTGVPPWFRMAHTLDDLIFFGQSLWLLERGAEGDILDADRVPQDRWKVDDNYRILIDDQPIDEKSVCYFQGPFEGLLTAAARTINAAIDIEKTWANRASVPLPTILLKQREQGTLTESEVKRYVEQIAAARRDPNGSVMFVPYEIEAEMSGEASVDLMTEARNAVKLDISDFLNLPSTKLDAALPKASLNYETQSGTDQELINRLPYWTGPIEARLSMDDITPRGTRIAFDFADTTTAAGGATGPYQED